MYLPDYLEPVYLNEKMLFNTAAYLLEEFNQNEEVIEEIKKKAGVRAGIGLSILV